MCPGPDSGTGTAAQSLAAPVVMLRGLPRHAAISVRVAGFCV